MKIIGLTGNIASGKSTVGGMLSALGAAHVDADALVHALYEAGSPVVDVIAAHFGPSVLAEDGSVDRRALGEQVFRDPAALHALEQIVHPWTGRLIGERVAALRSASAPPPAVVIEAVKLIESGRHEMADELWFVVAQPDVQRQRLIERRGWSEAEADARLAAQPSLKARLHHADVILENSGALPTLERQVRDAWQRLIQPSLQEDNSATVVE